MFTYQYGTNALDYSKITMGKYMNQNGNAIDSDTYWYSDYISVEEGQIIVAESFDANNSNYKANSNLRFVTAFDAYKNVMSDAGVGNTTSMNAQYTVPADVKYVILSIGIDSDAKFMVELTKDGSRSKTYSEYIEPHEAVKIEAIPTDITTSINSLRNDIDSILNKDEEYSISIYDIKEVKDNIGDGLIQLEDIEMDYIGGVWQNVIKQYDNIPAGVYYISIDKMVSNSAMAIYVEYDDGFTNTDSRIMNAKEAGIYKFSIGRENYNEVLQIRILVSNAEEQEPGKYGCYGIKLFTEEAYNKVLIPENLTGISTVIDELDNKYQSQIDNKLDKKYGKNLFNKNDPDVIINAYLAKNGTVNTNNTTYGVSHFIKVDPSTQYSLSSVNFGGGALVFFDQNKNAITSASILGNDLITGGTNTITTPENAEWMRTTFRKTEIDDLQIEVGTDVTIYEAYTENYDLLVLDERVELLETKLDSFTGSNKEQFKRTTTSTLKNGETITIAQNIDVKKCKSLSFFGRITSFDSISLGHGETSYGGTYITVDNTNIYVYNYNASLSLYKTIEHGLTISEFINILIDVQVSASITITTATGKFTTSGVSWSGCNGAIFAKSVNSEFTDCECQWTCGDLNSDIWVFGDSYLGLTSKERFPYYILELGFDKWLACGYPGAGTSAQLLCFKNLLAMGAPKIAVWTLGMNNADSDTAINSTYKSNTEEFISICNNAGIVPVISTIPSAWGSTSEDSDITVTRNHMFKNTWVKEQECRYIDFEKAVGADIGNGWYEGMLSTDGVHPTVNGAIALATRLIADVPEITMR